MTPEMDDFLVLKFPTLYRDRYAPMNQTCMCWGFPDDGWAKIIYELSEELEFLGWQFDIDIIADQVKEKFGTLRFYIHLERTENVDKNVVHMVSRIAHDLISNKEFASAHTCEKCGDRFTAKQRKGGWIKTLCDKCEEERNASVAERQTPGS